MKFKINPVATLPIACPQCGKQEDQLLSRLRDNPDLVCQHCGLAFRIDANQIDAVFKMLEQFNS